MLKTISAMKARQNLGQIINEVSISEDTYIIERAGKPLVAVIPVREYERIQQDREKSREEFFQWVDKIHEHNKDIDPDILEKEIEEAVEAVKKEELAKMTQKVEGHADFIISGDHHLKNLKFFQRIPILNPEEFLKRYAQDKLF